MAHAPPLTAGERWSRELLAGLRADGYRPAAWVVLLDQSFAHAAASRGARPALARQARRWGIAGAAATLAAAPAGRARPLAGLAWWAACCAMLESHLGMVEGPSGEPRARLSGADALTLLRLGLVPLAAAPADRTRWAATIIAAAASDVADGRLARRAGPTRLGRDLDSYSDAAFLAAAVSGAARAGWLPRSAAIATLARQGAGFAFTSAHWFARGAPPPLSADTRWAAGPTTAGLLLAAGGARRAAAGVLGLTTAAALIAHATALARDRRAAGAAAR